MASGGLLGNCRQEFKKDKRPLIFFLFNNKLIQTQKEIWQKRSLPQHYKHGFVSVRLYQTRGSTWCTYSRVFIHRWDLKHVFSLQWAASGSVVISSLQSDSPVLVWWGVRDDPALRNWRTFWMICSDYKPIPISPKDRLVKLIRFFFYNHFNTNSEWCAIYKKRKNVCHQGMFNHHKNK